MTIWIAKLLGPVIVALSLRMIVAPAGFQETARRFLADRPLVLISGVLAMTAGLSIVNTHNVWTVQWPLIVTLFGWALLLGGAVRVVAPKVVDDLGGAMMDRRAGAPAREARPCNSTGPLNGTYQQGGDSGADRGSDRRRRGVRRASRAGSV